MTEFIKAIKQILFLKDQIISLFQGLSSTQKQSIIELISTPDEWKDLDDTAKALTLRRNAFKVEAFFNETNSVKTP